MQTIKGQSAQIKSPFMLSIFMSLHEKYVLSDHNKTKAVF